MIRGSRKASWRKVVKYEERKVGEVRSELAPSRVGQIRAERSDAR